MGTTDQVPGTDIYVDLDHKEWAIYKITEKTKFPVLLDCGIARTRIGAKWAIIRRVAPLAFKPENQTAEQDATDG